MNSKHKHFIETFNNAVYVDTQENPVDGKTHIYFRATPFAMNGIAKALGKEAVHMYADGYKIEVSQENEAIFTP